MMVSRVSCDNVGDAKDESVMEDDTLGQGKSNMSSAGTSQGMLLPSIHIFLP